MTGRSIYWYDFETFGADPRRDRAAQFAGIRTDEELNIIDEPLVIYCKPANDFLPSPEACLITGITPQQALAKGLNEAEFIRLIHQQFATPQTCVAGFNSIRFDDELTRQLLYRNFYDPYEREYKAGNSRWDIIDMMRLCAAVRPQGINWPTGESGEPSFRLEKLTESNGIAHGNAHDALADVIATIEMAKLVKVQQPKLYDYVYKLRLKEQVGAQLDVMQMKPVVHVSAMYAVSRGCLAVVAPVCHHPIDKNGILVYDLNEDPQGLLEATADQIKQRVFSRQDDLPDGIERIPLKTLHLNRCPIVAPITILDEETTRRLGIDKERCTLHWEKLSSAKGLPTTVRKAFEPDYSESEEDPDFMIYSGGFFSEGDRKLMAVIRQSTPEQLAKLNLPFRDRRLEDMFFRYRARNFPQTLDAEERGRWSRFCHSRLVNNAARVEFEAAMERTFVQASKEQKSRVLEPLRAFVDEVASECQSL